MQKRLYRSRKHRMLLGVCGGLAEHFNADPTVIRLVVAVFALFDGLGILAYIILAVVLPADETRDKQPAKGSVSQVVDNVENTVEEFAARVEEKVEGLARESTSPSRERHSPWFGIALIVGGLWLLARNLGLIDRLGWHMTWSFRQHSGYIVPVVLVIVGAALVLAARRKHRE